jgi:vancomycin permeability regulator SanA
MRRVALVFGYGQKHDGKIDEQTRDRCEAGAKLYRQGKVEKIYLTVSASKAGIAMASGMRKHLVSQGVNDQDIVEERRGGNTAGEMIVFLSLVPLETGVVFVSTWYHLPRIFWLALWRISCRRFRLKAAWRHAHFRADVIVEFAKIANAFLQPKSSAKVLQNRPASP